MLLKKSKLSHLGPLLGPSGPWSFHERFRIQYNRIGCKSPVSAHCHLTMKRLLLGRDSLGQEQRVICGLVCKWSNRNREWGGLLSIWLKCPFALLKMPSYILWQNALFQNALFKGHFNKSILSRNIEGHFLKSKRAFHICSLEMPSYTTWQNALIQNALFEKGILNKSIL